MDQRLIEWACSEHGAEAVYAAAYEAIGGRRSKLVAVELDGVRGHNALSTICSLAQGLMSDDERARTASRYATGE